MKLSETMKKLTWMKSQTFRVLGVATLAGAALTAAAPAAQAQDWQFGVQVGGPQYYYTPAPAYRYYNYGPSYYDHERWEAWRRHEAHEAWERRERAEEWRREHYGYNRGYYGYNGYNGYYGR